MLSAFTTEYTDSRSRDVWVQLGLYDVEELVDTGQTVFSWLYMVNIKWKMAVAHSNIYVDI